MSTNIVTYLTDAVRKYKASDVFIVTGREVSFRVNDLVLTRSELEQGYTEKAVKQFQKAKGLKVTGKVDEKTAKKLKII